MNFWLLNETQNSVFILPASVVAAVVGLMVVLLIQFKILGA